MKPELLRAVAELLLKARNASGTQNNTETWSEVLGEVYLQVLAAIRRQSVRSRIDSLEAFVRAVARREYRRIHWRERKQADEHSPTRDNVNTNLESGVAIDRLGYSPSQCPLDELVHREDCWDLEALLDELPELDQQLLWSLTDETKGFPIRELARRTGSSVRTLQRRRQLLRDRIRRALAGCALNSG